MVQEVAGKEQLLRLLATRVARRSPRAASHFCTGVRALDELAPDGAFRRGAVHELLAATASDPLPLSLARLLAVAATAGERQQLRAEMSTEAIVAWSDPTQELYAPALAAAGLAMDRLVLLRPRNSLDELRMVTECLRCPGVTVTVAPIGRLTRVEARRLQLAAERGGGVGLFLRRAHDARVASVYAAATRWLVRPVPGSEDVQRWTVELMHGHGGRVGEVALLEVDRESGQVHAVRSPAAVADRPAAPASARASA